MQDILKLLINKYPFVNHALLTVCHVIKMQLLNQSNAPNAIMGLLC